jgi:hypothetical protein
MEFMATLKNKAYSNYMSVRQVNMTYAPEFTCYLKIKIVFSRQKVRHMNQFSSVHWRYLTKH